VKTYSVKASEIRREWYIVDAAGENVGRLATRIATILRGKHKPVYSPGMDVGDFIIVINADKVTVTGNKLEDRKYYRHSLHPGGLTTESMAKVLATHPTRILEHAVKGMLPKNRLGNAMIKKLKIYAGSTHPHAAQQPKPMPR
jgi:large subunit ribosomal protein L13